MPAIGLEFFLWIFKIFFEPPEIGLTDLNFVSFCLTVEEFSFGSVKNKEKRTNYDALVSI